MKKGASNVALYFTLILVVALLIVGGIILASYYNKGKSRENVQETGFSKDQVFVPVVFRTVVEQDYSNFEEILKRNEMIQDLPDSGTIFLRFYDWTDQGRVWQRNYILTKNKVVEGTIFEYDIKLVLHSKYLTILNKDNLCQVFNLAKDNGDFGSETKISKTKLLWRYKGMMEHKDCLGL